LWLTVGLREGKNREIKKVLASFNLEVSRLIRLSFGPFQLGELASGTVQEVPGRVLRDQLGERLTRLAKAALPGLPQEDMSAQSLRTSQHARRTSPKTKEPGIQPQDARVPYGKRPPRKPFVESEA